MVKSTLFAKLPEMVEQSEELADGTKLVANFVEADAQLLREVVSYIIEQPGRIVLLGTINGEQVNYAFGRSTNLKVDMGNLLKESARLTGGKGGGRADFAQGGGTQELLPIACKLLKELY